MKKITSKEIGITKNQQTKSDESGHLSKRKVKLSICKDNMNNNNNQQTENKNKIKA